MLLKKYQQKRKFDTTPEPSGHKIKNHKQLRFVVQKHHASHLHYDFRLEMAGVLKSWAIPKGPSLNPADKRLAMMVEDHPYEYKDFEGTIPQGNYGAGNVIIWDEGTYEPVNAAKNIEKSLLNQLKQGQLSFILHGKKLKGEFHLIKLNNYKNNSKNAWLLIKKADEFSSQQDILKNDKSVRSGKSLQPPDKEAAAPKRKPAKKKLTKMPSNIKPMLAKLVKAPFDRDGWLFEIKWDGFRIIAYITDGKAKLISRNNKDYSQIFYPVYQELSHLKSQMILDGEMVVVDKKGRSEFQLLQQFQKTGKGRLVYYVFDLLWLNGKDLRELPLLERKQLLKKHLPTLEYVQISNHILKKGIGFFQAALTHGLEGIIAKDANSPYLSGQRTSYWLKIKTNKRQEAIICGYTAPKGSRKNLGALVLGLYENNHLKYIGHAGSGFNQLTLKDLKTRLDKLAQTESPFEKPPKTNAPVTWVKPQLVCEVKFGEWTKEGHMRQPIFVGLREDKPASSVKQEPVIATPPTNNR